MSTLAVPRGVQGGKLHHSEDIWIVNSIVLRCSSIRSTTTHIKTQLHSHLDIDRAHALRRELAKATVADPDFLTLWEDADPDVPVLKQAKAENAKLN
jgi:hypothetical protein